jgi:hypothetical protein
LLMPCVRIITRRQQAASAASQPSPAFHSIREEHRMRLIVLLLAMAFSGAVFAKADCKANPKSEWMKEEDAKAKIVAQGYKIRVFKVSGNCYEIYGTNKDGKKVEIYYDTKTLDVVKSEIEK